MPKSRPTLRVRWRNASAWQRAAVVLGGVVVLPVAAVVVAFAIVFVINFGRVTIGDAQPGPVAGAWRTVDLDSLTARALVQSDTLGPIPPILDSLVPAWQASENGVYPHLIVKATPLHGGDVAVVLNPVFYRVVTPADQAARVAAMRESWRFVLANSGVSWPTDGSYPAPRVIVYRLESADPTPRFAIVAFPDSASLTP